MFYPALFHGRDVWWDKRMRGLSQESHNFKTDLHLKMILSTLYYTSKVRKFWVEVNPWPNISIQFGWRDWLGIYLVASWNHWDKSSSYLSLIYPYMGVNLALPSRPVYGILLGFRKIGTKLELNILCRPLETCCDHTKGWRKRVQFKLKCPRDLLFEIYGDQGGWVSKNCL